MSTDKFPQEQLNSQNSISRRKFIKGAAVAAAASAVSGGATQVQDVTVTALKGKTVDMFNRPDSLYHGDGWETLNPGYWQIKDGALRRRLKNYGDRARSTGFPFHYETHQRNGGKMDVDYDPSLPHGSIYRRDWKLTGNYSISIDATVKALGAKPGEGDSAVWKNYQPGYGMMGIVVGAKSLFDSFNRGNQGWRAVWTNDNKFSLQPQTPARGNAKKGSSKPLALKVGDRVKITVQVTGANANSADLGATISVNGESTHITVNGVSRKRHTDGYFGVVGRGLLDFGVNAISISPGENQLLNARLNECHNCYALGTTLREENGAWRVKFVSLFRGDGKRAEIRIADSENPKGGWADVPVAGSSKIVNNNFRRNTSVIDAKLPVNPASATLYYTVWKDGKNVTADPRIGSDAVGLGTGMVGDVPASGGYVGRLPQLIAPYRMAGLSCHAINGAQAKLPEPGKDGGFLVRDQPTYGAYKHLEDYDMQVMVWEDDVWYMELFLYPPSTDDAYKVVNTSISGPTSRWQMMRHWNVINPGDHDYGMDDVKGAEQIVVRIHDGLGQDRDYMRRNFQMVHHLITGEEEVDPIANPKKWRQWKMPNRDFTLLVIDSRLWRSSQDTKMWDDEGWGHLNTLYDRSDPTRSLLGEEQFAWLQDVIRTDSSRLICLTGINGMHTVWTGGKRYSKTDDDFAQRDRVAADYAGWVTAGCDRVIELLSSREGVVSVYGDVHNGCIMKNVDHRLYECSFGPIGRSGGRGVIEGFGPRMKDYDGRDVEIQALYHASYGTPDLKQVKGPFYWNFLEMHFDPARRDPQIGFKIRNMIDAPTETPRGGGVTDDVASNTGRANTCKLPELKTLPNADVRFVTRNGRPIRATRSLADGSVPLAGLVGPGAGETVMMTVNDGKQADARLVKTG